MSSSEEEEFTGDADEDDEDFEAEEGDDEEEANGDADEDDGSEGDEPLAALKTDSYRKKRAAKSAPSYKDDDDDDEDDESEEEESSDDDVPLSSLATSPKTKTSVPAAAKKPAATVNGTKKKKAAESPKKKKKKAALKREASTVSSSSNSNKNYEWASAALYGTSCDKGLLIQRLLCRWWYAYEWPTDIPSRPPANYDALDGFPGVFICTSPDAVGHIQDTRDAATAPTFQNFAKKPAEELRDMLVKALEEQTRQLVAAEGSGTATETELRELLKWARKVNAAKADKEAATVLKSQGLKLPSS